MFKQSSLALLLSLACSATYGQNYLMNANLTSISDCNGYFMDSGGGTATYAANENFTTTICSDGSSGTHVQLVFNGTDIAAGDELCFFDGPNTAAPSLNCASDFNGAGSFIIQATAANPGGCLTVTWTSNDSGQASGWSASIHCIPACQLIEAVVDSTYPGIVPQDTGWIDICPGERVFLFGKGNYPQNGLVYQHSGLTSNFSWDFGDGATSVGPTTSHVFNEPGGYIIQLTITDQFGCRNTNFPKQRVRVAPRPEFTIGDYTNQICAGDTVHLNAIVDSIDMQHDVSVTNSQAGFQTTGVLSDSLALPDGNGASYSTSISFSGFSPGQTLNNIEELLGIFVTMEHSWLRDLQIRLTCPNGQTAILHNHPGQTGNEVFLGQPYEADEGFPVPIPGVGWEYGWTANPDFNYTWIQYANLFSPESLPPGTYESYQPLENFLGCPLNGDWTIEVTDLWPIDNGYIFSWSIAFDPALYPFLEMFQPQFVNWGWLDHPSALQNTPDSLIGLPLSAGQVAYTFSVTDEFGCVWDTSVQIQVLPVTHPDCHNCETLLNPLSDTTLCIDETFQLQANGTQAADPPVSFESWDLYPIGAANHPPNNPYISVINVNSVQPATLTNPLEQIVSVCLDLETDFDADIRIYLRAPNGPELELSTGNGGSGDNYTQTCFSPSATIPITAGTPPFTGTFLPEGNWNVLTGAPVNGNWQLRLSDAFGINNYGTLNRWSITFQTTNQVTYSWNPSAQLSCTNCPDPVLTASSGNTFSATATDLYGCQTTQSFDLTVLNSYPAPEVVCEELPGGIMNFTWNDLGAGISSYLVNVNGNGWVPNNQPPLGHTVSGLSFGSSVQMEVQANISGSACDAAVGLVQCQYSLCPLETTFVQPAPYNTCFGICDAEVELAVLNAATPLNLDVYNLSNGTTYSQSSELLTGLCAGNYEVIITDDGGCMDTVSFSVGEFPEITLSAVQLSEPTCASTLNGCAMASATGGSGGFSYIWGLPNLPFGDTICTLGIGPVTLTAIDVNGCEATTALTITGPTALSLTFSTDSVNCTGTADGSATVTPSGGAGAYSFQWSGGSTPDQANTSGLTAGSYTVTVTDANGCTMVGGVAIGQPSAALAVVASQTLTGCAGLDQNEATTGTTGGTGPYTWQWLPSGQQTATATGLPTGQHIVVATDTKGCTASDTLLIAELNPIVITIIANAPTCFGMTDGEMAVNLVTGGTGTYNAYLWSNNQTGPVITALAGNATYTITVTDDYGCTGTRSRTLDEPPPLTVTASADDALCAGQANGSATVTEVANAQGPVQYQWSPAAGAQTTPTAQQLAAGTYSVVVTDSAGCSTSASVTIEVPEPVAVSITTTGNSCFGYANGAADAHASGGVGGYQYAWSTGSTTAKVVNLPAGDYTVTVTDANGCEQVAAAMVGEPDPLDAQLEVSDVRCFGEQNGTVSAAPSGGTPPFRFSLDGVNYFGTGNLIGLPAGDYSIFIEDGKGCIFEESFSVAEPQPMSAQILVNGVDTSMLMVPFGTELVLEVASSNAQGDVLITWDASYCGTLSCDGADDCAATPLCQTVVALPDNSNFYSVLVIDENGCEATAHFSVHVRKEHRVMVPTGFTPNADGVNDQLPVHGQQGTIAQLFRVFDRWGELLFEQRDLPVNDLSAGWDGNFRSQPMPPGVYVWYLEVEYSDGMLESLQGQTTLIR